MKHTIILVFLLTSYNLFGQTSYSGFIGKYPIELVTNISSDGDARAIYAYSNFDEPIVINGNLKYGKLTFIEKDINKKNGATLIFDGFDSGKSKLQGVWTDLKTQKKLMITLRKTFKITSGDNIEWADREILQSVSIDNKYFKLIVSKKKGVYSARVTGVKIVERKTDKLLQKIDLDCQLLGLDNLSIGDYNFDGIADFSVFESSYAGPNTSSLYFLYDPKTQKYYASGFEGTSLEFDNPTKRIFEHNQSCAGRQQTTAIYKVINNKMVLVEQHCYIWDEKKQDLIERKMKDCE